MVGRKAYTVLALITSAYLSYASSFGGPPASDALQKQTYLSDNEARFQWDQITPDTQLNYTPCYDGLQCARLSVPLNWNATAKSQENHRAAIAVIKRPAKVSVTHEQYGGIVVVNPGGPGESGIDEVINLGSYIQTIVDSPHPPDSDLEESSDGKYFDILGFDPRGVKYTTPSLNCFSNAFQQQMWLLGFTDYGMLWESDSAIGLEWAKMQALGSSCSAGDDDGIVRFLNTAQVVEDVREIIEKHGEWRAREVERLISAGAIAQKEVLSVRQRTSYIPGKEVLQFWGMSAGTILGQTFATVYPDRVGRIVIDGVLDPDDYYSGSWLHNLHDSDRIMIKLCEYCFEAGPKCPVYIGNSAKDIQDHITDLVFGLRNNPVAILADTLPGSGPMVVTFGDVYLRVIGALAFPFSNAENVFSHLAEISKGNFTSIAEFKAARMKDTAAMARCNGDIEGGCFPEKFFGLLTATATIECMDSAKHRRDKNFTKEDFKNYCRELYGQSKWYSAAWARHRMFCVGFEAEPAWSFGGPISGDTRHPLLIIGNTHDTVTPLQNARHVSTLFNGSVVLQQDSEGHTSRAMPSLCTAKYMRQYFQTGKLPEPATICQPDYRPFVGSMPKTTEVEKDAEELSLALAALARSEPSLYF